MFSRFNVVTTKRRNHEHGGFRVKTSLAKSIAARKKKILKRLAQAKANRFTRCFSNHVDLLKWHAPYHESDHVLAMVMNVLFDGTRLEHMELL